MAELEDDGDGRAVMNREEVARLLRISRYTHLGGTSWGKTLRADRHRHRD
jgi:hypothetical protein